MSKGKSNGKIYSYQNKKWNGIVHAGAELYASLPQLAKFVRRSERGKDWRFQRKIKKNWYPLSQKQDKITSFCNNCGETGHIRCFCPQVECRKCGEFGHTKRYCVYNF